MGARRTLIFYLGNPIVRNDQIGLIVGGRLAASLGHRSDVTVREFSGSPLDLVTQAAEKEGEGASRERLILIDAVCTGSVPEGTVMLFREEELLDKGRDFYPHGMNVADALALGRRLGLPLPEKCVLVGIEAARIEEFGEELSPALAQQLERIYREVLRAVRRLLAE